MVGELADEAARVRAQQPLAIRRDGLRGGRVERREQPVLDEHAGARQRVEQRALARVRVADERGAELAAAARALRLALALDRFELALEPRDLLAHQTPVRLELGLTRSARADARGLPLEMLPHAGESRQRVLELGELDLQAALPCPRAPGE